MTYPTKRLSRWLAATVGLAAFVACANDEPVGTGEPDPGRPLPGADGGDPDLSPEAEAPLSCEASDFCPVKTPISSVVTLNAIWGRSASDLWMVGTGGTILHGDGTTFTIVPSGTEAILLSVWAGGDDVWIIAGHGPLRSRRLPGGGIDWVFTGEDPPPVTRERIWAIWGSSPSDVWMAGEYTYLNNEGSHFWSLGSTPEGATLFRPAGDLGGRPGYGIRALWGAGPNDIWGIGSYGAAFRYEGSNEGGPGMWKAHESATTVTLEAVWGSSADDVWAVGQDGTIRHRTKDSAFTAVPSPTTHDLHALWGSGPSDIWAAGDRGTILHYDGKEWALASANLEPNVSPDLFGAWGSGPDDVWIVGRNVVLHRTASNRRRP